MLAALELDKKRAMEIIGGKAESYAKGLARTNSGTLKNFITHRVESRGSQETVTVGTNVYYAPYVELGTGPLFESPPAWMQYTSKRGRGIVPWYWKDDAGEWHVSYGAKPYPFLRPAIEDHKGEYEDVIKSELHNA